jgi:hypothetical protein
VIWKMKCPLRQAFHFKNISYYTQKNTHQIS